MHSKWSVVDKIQEIASLSLEDLEAFRQKEIEALINSAPEKYRRRLQGIQFQVDAQRQKHSNPLGSCAAISNMMQDSLNKLNTALRGNEIKKDVIESSSVTELLPCS